VLEAERPVEERLSVFDRPAAEDDALPRDRDHMANRGMDPASLRLVAAAGPMRLYLAHFVARGQPIAE
jgi:hypothetical protein